MLSYVVEEDICIGETIFVFVKPDCCLAFCVPPDLHEYLVLCPGNLDDAFPTYAEKVSCDASR